MAISLREFARRNGVDVAAISRAVKAGRIPSVDGKIDPEQAQPVWDRVKDRGQVGRRLKRGSVDPASVNTQSPVDPLPVNTQSAVDLISMVNSRPRVNPAPVNTAPPALKRLPATVAINGAEYYDLLAGATAAGITIQAYARTQCGLPPWISRGREMANRTQAARRLKALARLNITIMVTEEEHATLHDQARAAGLSLPQYVRTRCGYSVRHSSQPGTEERVKEEDEAWDILRQLGMNADDYFVD